jgi:3-hydroxybutyryl-CoA dehydratase
MRAATGAEGPVLAGERFSKEHRFTPEGVIAFAMAAGDDNPLHHDAEFAANSRFGGLIVSGTHTTALLLGLTASHFSTRGTVVGCGFSVRFERPVPADECITLEWAVARVEPLPGRDGQHVWLQGRVLSASGSILVSATGEVRVGIDLSPVEDRNAVR